MCYFCCENTVCTECVLVLTVSLQLKVCVSWPQVSLTTRWLSNKQKFFTAPDCSSSSAERGGCHSPCGASRGPPGTGTPPQHPGDVWVSSRRFRGEWRRVTVEGVCVVRASEARVAGQRSKRHLHVLLHDDVKTTDQRPGDKENYFLLLSWFSFFSLEWVSVIFWLLLLSRDNLQLFSLMTEYPWVVKCNRIVLLNLRWWRAGLTSQDVPEAWSGSAAAGSCIEVRSRCPCWCGARSSGPAADPHRTGPAGGWRCTAPAGTAYCQKPGGV